MKQKHMHSEVEETLLESSRSLRERFQEEKKMELKVERKAVIKLQRIWGMILNGAAAILAFIGLCSLLHPVLRSIILTVFVQFIREIGLF